MKDLDSEAKAFEQDLKAMDRFGRQVGEFGVATMAKLIKTRVLVLGLTGVGIEAAKNLVLLGVGQVTLLDETVAQDRHRGANFYLAQEHVGRSTIADAVLPRLKALNALVNVDVHSGELTNKHVKDFDVVLDCGLSGAEAAICNEQCRRQAAKTKFVRCLNYGLSGFMFTDFCDEFTVNDKSGEPVVSRVIDTLTWNSEAPDELKITLMADQRHNIDIDGHVNFVKFSELEGPLTKLNDQIFEVDTTTIKTKDGKQKFDPYGLVINLSKLKSKPDFKETFSYDGSGQIIQVKKPVKVKFNSLKKSILDPVDPDEGMLKMLDGAKWGRADQLHFAFRALWDFEAKHGKLPSPNNVAEANECVELAKKLNDQAKETKAGLSLEAVDDEVVRNVALYSSLKFQPLCAFFGGIVAQEVVKLTGKYTPLNQWVHLDCFEVLPEQLRETEVTLAVDERTIAPDEHSRYDDLIQIIGKSLFKKLQQSSTFMIGCGALGCELLKNFAMIGLACDPKGLVTVTDNDSIEVSNLSRQFLFREENVGQPKSLAAGKAIKAMNPNFNVKSLESLVGLNSEDQFNAAFWLSQNFITNALDNVEARLYVDQQCVFYGLPLLESGTLGTKCNSQVIVPFKTASYADGPKDDGGGAIAMCTLRNFPSKIEHCIEWGRGRFSDLFEVKSGKAANFLVHPEEYIKELKSKQSLNDKAREYKLLTQVVQILRNAGNGKTNFELCLQEAYAEFHAVFRDKISSLIRAKPLDAVDDEKRPFWGKNRRFPSVATFDLKDDTHIDFVMSMANVLSLMYGVVSAQTEFVKDREAVRKIVADFTPPKEKISEVDLSEDQNDDDDVEKFDEKDIPKFTALVTELESIAKGAKDKIVVEPIDFEKDDDNNCHIDFITAATNLRARNYQLKEETRHQCKMIAGKIIPAIATTTAAVTGLVCIEMLKLIQEGKKVEAFKDSSNSLGVNLYQMLEPAAPVKAKDFRDEEQMVDVVCVPKEYTKWDKTLIEGKDLTLDGFLKAFSAHCKKQYQMDLEITCLLHTNANQKDMQGFSKFVYMKDVDEEEPTVGKENLNRPLKEVLTEIYGEAAVGKSKVRLDCNIRDKDDNGFSLPQLIFSFK